MIRAGIRPLGKIPPLPDMRWNPVGWPFGVPKITNTMPRARKTSRAMTLISENQNSISPKTLTEIRFITTTITTTRKAMTHCGIAAKTSKYCPNQRT